MSKKKLVFSDLEPKEVEVEINGKEYVLVEAMADTEVKFHDAMSREMSVDTETKKVRAGAVHIAEPLAVSKCLWELRPQGVGRTKRMPVPIDTILRWPPRVYQELFRELAAMSPGLVRGTPRQEEALREEEKNSPSSGEDTSDSLTSLEPASTD